MAKQRVEYSDLFSSDINQGLQETSKLLSDMQKTSKSFQDSIKKGLSEITSEKERLNKVIKDSQAVIMQMNTATKENHAELNRLESTMRKAANQYKELTKEEKALKDITKNLTPEVARLEKEYKKLSKSIKEAAPDSKKFKESARGIIDLEGKVKGLTKVLEKASDSSKKASKAGEGFKEYKGAVLQAAESVGLFDLVLGNLQNGFKFIKSAPKLFQVLFGTIKASIASTGIGVFLLAFGSLITFLSKTQKGADLLATALAPVGVIIDTLFSALLSYGKLLINIWTDPIGAIKNFGSEIFDLGAGFGEATLKAIELQKAIIALDEQEIKNIVAIAVATRELEKQKNIRDEEFHSLQKRIKANEKAQKEQSKLFDIQIKQAREELRIAKEQLANKDQELVTREELKEVAEKEAEIIDLQAEKEAAINEQISNRVGLRKELIDVQRELLTNSADLAILQGKVIEGSAEELKLREEIAKKKVDAELAGFIEVAGLEKKTREEQLEFLRKNNKIARDIIEKGEIEVLSMRRDFSDKWQSDQEAATDKYKARQEEIKGFEEELARFRIERQIEENERLLKQEENRNAETLTKHANLQKRLAEFNKQAALDKARGKEEEALIEAQHAAKIEDINIKLQEGLQAILDKEKAKDKAQNDAEIETERNLAKFILENQVETNEKYLTGEKKIDAQILEQNAKTQIQLLELEKNRQLASAKTQEERLEIEKRFGAGVQKINDDLAKSLANLSAGDDDAVFDALLNQNTDFVKSILAGDKEIADSKAKTNAERMQNELAYLKGLDEADADATDKRIKRKEKEAEEEEAIKQRLQDNLKQLAEDARVFAAELFANDSERKIEQYEQEKSDLQTKLDEDLALYSDNAQKQQILKEEAAEKQKALDKKIQAEERKKAIVSFLFEKGVAIGETVINTVKAATAVLPNFPLAASIALVGAANVAKIVSTKPKGLKDGTPAVDGPGTETSDSIPAMLSKRERVMSARHNKQIGLNVSNDELVTAWKFYQMNNDRIDTFEGIKLENEKLQILNQQEKISSQKAIGRAVAKGVQSRTDELLGMGLRMQKKDLNQNAEQLEELKKISRGMRGRKYRMKD